MSITKEIKCYLRFSTNSTKILLCFIFLVIFPHYLLCQNPSQSDYTKFLDSLNARIQEGMKNQNIPGLSIAIVDGDKTIWSKGFGLTDISKRQPVNGSTLFSVQSISKTYTTIGFLRAVERGEIRFDDKLVRHYPTFIAKTRYGGDEIQKITFRHLLSHWAGFPHEAPLGGNYDDRYSTFNEHIESLSDSWMKARVGSRYSYSNVGIDLVGYALQRVSKKPFEQYMKTEVLEPLGMKDSTFSFSEARGSKNFAQGHIEGKPVPVMRVPMQPSGGMYSTADDLAKFIVFALNQGKINNRQFIAEKNLDEISEIHFPLKNQTGGYGLGMEIGQIYGSKLLRHGGSGYGYSTMQAWLPEYNIGVVVLANAGDIGFSDELAHEVLRKMVEIKNPSTVSKIKDNNQSKSFAPESGNSLKKFEGNYKTYGQVVGILTENNHLVLRRGNSKTILKRIGVNSFATENGEALDFKFGKNGQILSVLSIGAGGVDTWFLNDRKDDTKGDFRPEWNKYLGPYRIGAYGNEFTTTISEKNGYLISSRNSGTKLIPFKDNVFFTPDGESVIFKDNKMFFGSRPAIKINTDAVATTKCENYPAADWTAWSSPQEAGWSVEKLNRAKEYAESIGSAAGMIVLDGRVLFEWGETGRKFNVHSIRKSLLGSLYGVSVDKGEINLSDTLEKLGIDDNPPSLSKSEKEATVRDLLEAKSGVFHPALYETADMIASKPKRNSHPHGTFWLYSNWDFNALGTIYERATYSTIFKEFKHRIATPLQMQDYETTDGEYVDGDASVHPAYPFRMTARDMARFGLLYQRGGKWCGWQILSEKWIKESTTTHNITKYKDGVGYGYLWWVGANGKIFANTKIKEQAYYAWGTGGHYIFVIPELKLVIVNRVNTDAQGKRINDEQFGQLVQQILEARKM